MSFFRGFRCKGVWHYVFRRVICVVIKGTTFLLDVGICWPSEPYLTLTQNTGGLHWHAIKGHWLKTLAVIPVRMGGKHFKIPVLMHILARFSTHEIKWPLRVSCILLCSSLQFRELSFQCFIYYHIVTIIPLWSTVIFSRYLKYGTYMNYNRRKKHGTYFSLCCTYIYIGKFFRFIITFLVKSYDNRIFS